MNSEKRLMAKQKFDPLLKKKVNLARAHILLFGCEAEKHASKGQRQQGQSRRHVDLGF
jgi:hypothetical protein